MIEIMSANAKQLNDTTGFLIESYKKQAETAEATIKAMRNGVEDLFEQPYQPTNAAIRRALYPSKEHIDYYRSYEGS
jgi:hypothetical protein